MLAAQSQKHNTGFSKAVDVHIRDLYPYLDINLLYRQWFIFYLLTEFTFTELRVYFCTQCNRYIDIDIDFALTHSG